METLFFMPVNNEVECCHFFYLTVLTVGNGDGLNTPGGGRLDNLQFKNTKPDVKSEQLSILSTMIISMKNT